MEGGIISYLRNDLWITFWKKRYLYIDKNSRQLMLCKSLSAPKNFEEDVSVTIPMSTLNHIVCQYNTFCIYVSIDDIYTKQYLFKTNNEEQLSKWLNTLQFHKLRSSTIANDKVIKSNQTINSLSKLPNDILLKILLRSDPISLGKLFLVNKQFSQLNNQEFWDTWFMYNYPQVQLQEKELDFLGMTWKTIGKWKVIKLRNSNNEEEEIVIMGLLDEMNNGKGIKLINNNKYIGHFQGGKYHGKGIYNNEKGKYKGYFRDGKCHGVGMYAESETSLRLEGDWRNGKLRKGTFVDEQGDKYEGTFVNGKFEGQGVYVDNEGNRYNGEWKNDRCNGHGTVTFFNGVHYTGFFVNGKATRSGTFVTPYGNKIEGSWFNNEFNSTPLRERTFSM